MKQYDLDIVIVGDHTLELTKQTYKSAVEQSTLTSIKIIVEPYQGYNRSLNLGAAKGDAPYIAFCNNDLIFHKGWDEVLLIAMKARGVESASPLCPRTHHQWWTKGLPTQTVHGNEAGKYLAGWCFVWSRALWEQHPHDERQEFWCADNATEMTLQKHKIDHILVPGSKVDHLQSTMLNEIKKTDPARYDALTRGEVKKFNRNYGQNKFNWGT